MNKKALYLFLALLLPGIVFLFLKFFGENKFDIPVYFQSGVSDTVNNCRMKTQTQYFVPDSSLSSIKWKKNSVLLVAESEEDELTLVKQIINDLGTKNVQLVSLNNLRYDQTFTLKNCVLFMRKPWNAVLVDSQKRIRGYYKLGNRDEMDRLEVELKILIKKY